MKAAEAREMAKQLARRVKVTPNFDEFRREGEAEEVCEECGAPRSSLGPIFHLPDCLFR